MSATMIKKPEGAPALASFFEQLSSLFSLPKAQRASHIAPKNLKATFKALKKAPDEELVSLRIVLIEMSSQIDRILDTEATDAENRAAVKRAAEKEDASVQRILADARGSLRAPEPAPSKDAVAAMAEMRHMAATALQRRIANKELLPPKEFQVALHVRRQSVSDAVKAGRMFAMVGPSGENYYPAFYADEALDRRPLERVTKALGPIPAASKYFFFTTNSVLLGGVTPLEALKSGRLPEVLTAAAGFAVR
jgi:hypothetical protein